MGKNRRLLRNCITAFGVAAVVFLEAVTGAYPAEAKTISEIQEQIDKDKKNLENINGSISSLEDEQDILQEAIDDLNSEIINIFTSIGLKEDEIAAKEEEITATENEIALKVIAIAQAEKDYEAAKLKEEQQYQAMKSNIRSTYENGEVSLLALLFGSASFADFLNKAEYTEMVYQYDQKLLESYEAAKQEVQDLWDRLEADKKQLEEDKDRLEEDRRQLEESKAELQDLKDELDRQVAEKEKESANFAAEIQRYKQEAAAAKKRIQQEENEIKRLQEEQRRREEEARRASQNAASGNYTDTGYASMIDGAEGSELGKKIAKFACQYIGNRYVYGGTSLTNGTDCSGFTYRVYKEFGYTLPRTSYEQRNVGKEVSYADAQPGDIICYSGHVAMYIGNGLIVHASNSKPYPSGGIKVSNATYKTIITVRRII